MAKLEIKFSAAEMLLITSSMKIASFHNLENFDQRYSKDELKIMLKTAKDSLLARGLVRTKEQNGKEFLDLHPVVKAAVGVAARPEKGWWLTITGENQKPRSIFFSWTEQLVISNWVAEEGIFCFEQVKENALPSAILNFSSIDVQYEKHDQIEYEIPVSILDTIVKDDKSFELSQLIQCGLAESDAKQLLEGMTSPLERCILIAVTNMREQAQNVGLIIWIVTDQQVWLIEQSNKAKDIAILKKASVADVLKSISSLMSKALII